MLEPSSASVSRAQSGAAFASEGDAGSMSGDLLEWLASVADDPYAFALGA